jgi:hypothetical protein
LLSSLLLPAGNAWTGNNSTSTTRSKGHLMRPKYYLIMVWQDIEPELHGPFRSVGMRNNHAKALRREHGKDHGLFPLNITAKGLAKVGSYTGGFFMEEEEQCEQQ